MAASDICRNTDNEQLSVILELSQKHPTEKLMRGGFGGGATPPTGGLGGRTPQKLGLINKVGSNAQFYQRVFA